ncbi:MAG TPA: type II toxin-antitoxin system PemK/MazF family toxin [Chloroflexia bacterium]|jgi:mRNA interferase MazF
MRSGSSPERGDVVWLTLDPQIGREQAGRRPALILSPAGYNGKTGLCLACPITSQKKGYPFEVALPDGLPVTGVVLADHARSLDWRGPSAEFICIVPESVIGEVTDKLYALIST